MFLTRQISQIHLETAVAEIGSLITVSHICPSAGNSRSFYDSPDI
jgi:hypothetical protein